MGKNPKRKMSAAKVVPLPYLPDDLIDNILTRLPVKSLLRFRSVCKKWRSWISDPDFISAHLNRTKQNKNHSLWRHLLVGSNAVSINYETLKRETLPVPLSGSDFLYKFFASCDGLVLLDGAIDTYLLWNPSTRSCKRIQDHAYFTLGWRLYGLGYDPSINNYKVIKVSGRFGQLSVNRVDIYNCQTNSWRRIDDCPYDLIGDAQGVSVNGAPHWIVTRSSRKDYVIVYFDMEEERFKQLPNPYWLDEDSRFDFSAFEESLCMIRCLRGEEFEIWVMKQYGVAESWTKLFVFGRSNVIISSPRPWCFRKNDEILMELRTGLTLYNLKENKHECVLKFLSSKFGFSKIAYIESLVPPGR